MLRLAVDFDGVIHDPKNVQPGYKLGQPIEGAVKALRQLKNDDRIIIIHSFWASTPARVEAITKWCTYFDIPYDFVTNVKPDADIYIDDKGYKFERWSDTLDYISQL